MGLDDVKVIRVTSRSPLWRSCGGGCETQKGWSSCATKLEPIKATREGSNILGQCTLKLCATYAACNPAFGYDADKSPKRALTEPTEGVSNGGKDNKNHELIIYVNDDLGLHHSNMYQAVGLLGSGTFGQVVKAVNKHSRDMVAVKVIKNHSAYFNQAKMEILILRKLQEKYAKDERFRVVQLFDYFMHFDHLCLVFEMLHVNLYELLRSNHYKGLSLTVIRVFLKQLLNALSILQEMHIIHCDLKPENILLCDQSSAAIKLIDFGSACFENQTVYTYIQSRYYRSPEVLCGYAYNSKIDMWSLGCILAELFLGLPLFPGGNDYNQMARIVEMCSYPPTPVLEGGKHASKYFKRVQLPTPPCEGIHNEIVACTAADKSSKQQEACKGSDGDGATPPQKSRPFSFNSMLSLGSSSPIPKDKGKKKKGKEDNDEREMGVEMTTISSYEHLDKVHEDSGNEQMEDAISGRSAVKQASEGSSQMRTCMTCSSTLECSCPSPSNQSLSEGKISPTNSAAPLGKSELPAAGQFPIIDDWQLKTEDEFCKETGATKVVWKRYFNYTQLEDLVMHVPFKEQADLEQEKMDRLMFADFLRGVLLTDFRERWTAEQALEHPFVNEEGRHLFSGPGRYHADVVLVENRRVEKARQVAEMQRMQMQQQPQHMQKTHTHSVPIPRQPGVAIPYPASWGSLIGTSPGYSSPPNATSTGSMQLGTQRNTFSSQLSTSPSSPYSRANSSSITNIIAADPSLEDLREHSPDFSFNDSFSISGSFDPNVASGLAHHLAFAQSRGMGPSHSNAEAAHAAPHSHGLMHPPLGHNVSASSSSGPIPMPHQSEGMQMPMMGLSFEQPHGPHLFPPSPIVQSPGSFYGAHMHAGAANQLLAMSPNFPNSPWDNYAHFHQKHPPNAGTQQRRSQKNYPMPSPRERAMSWSAPKPSSLSQLMAASRSSVSSSIGTPGGTLNPKAGYPPQAPKQVPVGSPAETGRHQQARNRRKGPPGGQGWGGGKFGAPPDGASMAPHRHGPQHRPLPQDAPDASWDPFFNNSEL